jgi:hypothetical protein
VIRLLAARTRAPLLTLEIGAGQASAVVQLMAGRDVELLEDLAGIERVAVGRL